MERLIWIVLLCGTWGFTSWYCTDKYEPLIAAEKAKRMETEKELAEAQAAEATTEKRLNEAVVSTNVVEESAPASPDETVASLKVKIDLMRFNYEAKIAALKQQLAGAMKPTPHAADIAAKDSLMPPPTRDGVGSDARKLQLRNEIGYLEEEQANAQHEADHILELPHQVGSATADFALKKRQQEWLDKVEALKAQIKAEQEALSALP